MNRQQEFRKQTEEAKLEAFSLMCRKVADLEKENAELKAVERMALYTKMSDQLTKAKEIIKGLKTHLDLSDCVNNDYRLQLLKRAEQFLSEVEK